MEIISCYYFLLCLGVMLVVSSCVYTTQSKQKNMPDHGGDRIFFALPNFDFRTLFQVFKVRVLSDFDGELANDLSIKTGDVLTIKELR